MSEKLKVLFASFEASPFIKTGGLGDVAGSLPAALCDEETEVRLVLPKLGTLAERYTERMKFITSFNVPLGWRNQHCGLFELEERGVTCYFLDNEYYFKRSGAYGYQDDGERMAFFAKAVCECMQHLPGFFPDILHSNDWHAALATVFLREQYQASPDYARVRTVFTIHNLRFQGQYDPWLLGDVLGLHQSQPAREQLIWGGALNFMAGAVSYADRVTTVSPTYADEICTAALGEGLESLFARRRNVLSGILNGIDTVSYDPAADAALVAPYSEPAGKAANKAALQKELGLPVDPEAPLCAVVSRLTEQKGMDLLQQMLWLFPAEGAQLVVLGTGDAEFENAFRAAAAAAPEHIAARIEFSEALSRRIYAGADIFLMPSRFEPCGLSQMISMRYGTVPVVRETGGLRDSVEPYNVYDGSGSGVSFRRCDGDDLRDAVRRALELYRDKDVWAEITARDMTLDFGWEASAGKYRALYKELME